MQTHVMKAVEGTCGCAAKQINAWYVFRRLLGTVVQGIHLLQGMEILHTNIGQIHNEISLRGMILQLQQYRAGKKVVQPTLTQQDGGGWGGGVGKLSEALSSVHMWTL